MFRFKEEFDDVKRIPRRLDVGKEYMVSFLGLRPVKCKFIRPTRCGFNFLNLKTNRCVLKYHLYRSKCENHQSEDWFFISSHYKIQEIYEQKP